jgi:hypothetical protein
MTVSLIFPFALWSCGLLTDTFGQYTCRKPISLAKLMLFGALLAVVGGLWRYPGGLEGLVPKSGTWNRLYNAKV